MSENENVVKAEKKQGFFEKIDDNVIEIVIVVLLGVTALLTAWASYAGSIHGGNQATNYATSNNEASDGNALYNQAVSDLNQDMTLWNNFTEYQLSIMWSVLSEDMDAANEDAYKVYYLLNDNLSDRMAEAIGWDFTIESDDFDGIIDWVMYGENNQVSPFSSQEYVDGYFEDSYAMLEQSAATLKQGQQDNANGDKFTLVTVIYSVVLFLLGILGVFKNKTNKCIVLIVSIVAFLFALIFMFTIPLPTSGGIFG